MKRNIPVVLALLLACLIPLHAAFAISREPAPSSPSPKANTPGVELAQALSTVTGVAISPLLGVGVVGAWKYCAASTPQQRAGLPWFAQPWFWIPALVIVGLCALKDTFGVTIPVVLKKPFDILETIEHKVSGLVAAGAFVPFIATVFHSANMTAPAGVETLNGGHAFLAVANGSGFLNLFAVLAMIFIFLVVCLASNAINILILLSPFPIIDFGLKLFRFALLALLALATWINPWLGAFFSMVIIIVAWMIAGWSLRLSCLGTVFIWDICTRHAGRFEPMPSGNWMFLGRKTSKVPIRTYGRFIRDSQGGLSFQYHPWLILPQRKLQVPAGEFVVARGLFYSEIVRVEGSQTRSVMLLSPRYRSHEAALAEIYGFSGVRDAGLRAAFVWFKDWLGFRPKTLPQIATG